MARKNTIPIYDLFIKCAERDDTLWHEKFRHLYNVRGPQVGEGENAYCEAHGLDKKNLGKSGRDFKPHNDREAKGVYLAPTHPGRSPGLKPIRAGKHARDAFIGTMTEMRHEYEQHYHTGSFTCRACGYSEKCLREPELKWENIKKILLGPLSAEQRELLPKWIWDKVYEAIKPSVGMAENVGGIVNMIPDGYVWIDVPEFDAGYDISGVSGAQVNYKLRRDYLENRSNLTVKRFDPFPLPLASRIQPVPDGISIDAFGQIPDECHAVSVG